MKNQTLKERKKCRRNINNLLKNEGSTLQNISDSSTSKSIRAQCRKMRFEAQTARIINKTEVLEAINILVKKTNPQLAKKLIKVLWLN